MLFKRNRIPFTIPDDARELTEEEMLLVNGGGPAMTPEDQASMSEACKNNDKEKQAEIMSRYNTTTTPPASPTITPTQPSTTPTATTSPTTVPTTPPANGSGATDNTTPPSFYGNGGSGSSGAGSGSGGSSGSGSDSGSGGYSSPSSTNSTTTSQHKPSVSEQERNLKVGLSHVEDYKKAAMASLGIRGTSPTGNDFNSNIKNKPVSANDYHEYAYYKSMSDCKHEKALDGRKYIPALTTKQQVELAKHGAEGMSIGYDKKVGGRKFIPGKQICKDETKEHCDIYAWNKAVERWLDPSMEKGTLLDLNTVKVNEMYETYYKQYCVPFDSNCAGKNGFLIYDWESNGLGRKDHIEYCEVGAGGDSYTYYKTDGIDLPKAVTYSFSVKPKATAAGNSTVVFLPLN